MGFFVRLVIFIAGLICLSQPSAIARHLVGGSLTYEYLGTTITGEQRYVVKQPMYRDNDVDSRNGATDFDGVIQIGVYEDDVDLNRVKTITIEYDSNDKKVEIPSGSGNCNFSTNLDFRQYTYIDTITLPPSGKGYHLAHPRCCRNNPANLRRRMGQYYYAFIPPTKLQNTSPDFNSVPAPYICVEDTAKLSYQAFEPDGDSLAYKMANPYTGGEPPPGNPKPGPPISLQLPLDNVNYNPGYSFSNPFGNNGIAKIDDETGVATLSAPSKGRYAIAVEVQEYRDGELISTTRRDIQIIVVDCPPNSPPESKIPETDSSRRSISVVEGNKVRFSDTFLDTNSMSLEATGGVFNKIDKPRANFSSSTRPDTLLASFTWQTACYHGRDQPYVFNYRVTDSGCPPKTAISSYQVFVKEYPGAKIKGPDSACQNVEAHYKARIGETGSDSVQWKITGGNITEGQYTDSVTIEWKRDGQHALKAITSNINGCNPDTAELKVEVFKPPFGAAGTDTTLCGGDTVSLGPEEPPKATSYEWSSAGLISKRDTTNPTYSWLNTSGKVRNRTVTPEIEQYACKIIDTVKVTINPKPQINSIQGDSLPCLGSEASYVANSDNGIQFRWFANGGSVAPSKEIVSVQWQKPDSGELSVVTENRYGCTSDTVRKDIYVGNPVVDTILGTQVVCPNSQRIRYWLDSNQENTYKWSVKGGSIGAGQDYGQVKMNWGDSGKGYVQVTEKTPEGCISDPFRLPIQIAYQLETSPIFGDTSVCEKSQHPYRVRYTNGSSYEWWVKNGQGAKRSPSNRLEVNWGPEGTGALSVLETSYDSVNDKYCRGDTIKQTVDLNPLPKPGPVRGPDRICRADTGVYYVSGFNGSDYEWGLPDEKARVVYKKGDSLALRFRESGSLKINLQEITKDSCLSPIKELKVKVKSKPRPSSIVGPDTVCLTNGLSETYNYQSDSTSDFEWQVSGGILADSTGESEVTINWRKHGQGQITVKEIAANGCIGKPVNKSITVDKMSLKIERVTTHPNKPDQLQFSWNANNPSYWKNPQSIFRNAEEDNEWEVIEEGLPAGELKFIDENANPNKSAFGYQVQSINLCGNFVKSEPHRAIRLKGEKQGGRSLRLNWSRYKGWQADVKEYEILRLKENSTTSYEVVKRVPGDKRSHLIESPSAGATQCYRIRAVKNGAEDDNDISWSNEICRDFPAYIYMPDAFTPWDENGLNDEYRVTTANLRSFKMMIFNRWGEKIFETDDPSDGWDGTYEGEIAPVGNYVVKVRYKGNGAMQEETTTLRLLR